MKIVSLKEKPSLLGDKTTRHSCDRFAQFIEELEQRDLPEHVINSINSDIEELNASEETGKSWQKLLNRKHTEIMALLKKECNLIPRNHYTTLWLVLGMSVFGMPLGIIYGQLMDNMGLLTLGLPVGMGVGVLVGSWLDQKAKKEGRQLNIENY